MKTVEPGNEECGCGNSTIDVGSNFKAITLSTSTIVYNESEPNAMKKCDGSNPRWVCGDVVYSHYEGGGSSTATYTVQCNQSANRCFRLPRDARFDH